MSVPAYQINGPGDGPPGSSLGTAPEPIGDPNDARQWLDRLQKRLFARKRVIDVFEAYYDGRQKLAFATEQFKKAFGNTFKEFADNWMEIVVDAVEERLNVQGFRIPGDPGAGTEALTTGDSEAWDIWQANDMDAGSQLVHTGAFVDSIAYVIVGPGDEYPTITGESALQVITECEPGSNERLAGLKRWKDDTTGLAYATVYLPDYVYKFISRGKTRETQSTIDWIPREVEGEQWPLENPIGLVPIVEFPNRPRLLGKGSSEIEQLIPLQNAINKLFMDMLVASEYAGFAQRWATGIEIPTDPETGQPLVDMMKMAMDRFLHTESTDAKFGTLQASDLSNYTGAIAMAIQHLASRSSTPPHYFLAHEGNFPSGEALKAAETGLVSKAKRRMRHFGEAWEAVIRLAFLMKGEETKARAARGAEVIWADPESRTESEHIDAIVKMSSLGVPSEILWEKSGYFSPQEIARMKELIAQGAPVATPPAPTGTQAGQGG